VSALNEADTGAYYFPPSSFNDLGVQPMIQKTHGISPLAPTDLGSTHLSMVHFNDLVLLAVLVTLLVWENLRSHRASPKQTLRKSYLTNFGTFFLNSSLMSILSVSSLLGIAENVSHWGLLSSMTPSFWKTLIVFFLLDLTLYFWHRANHQIDHLWLFHKVHHSDQCVNVSTAFRLHFIEVLLTTVVKGVFIVIVGVETSIVLMNEMLITFFVMFHHSNAGFKYETILSRLLIVPSLHRRHHSVLRREHDQNYGAVLSGWDKLFGTLSVGEPEIIGLQNIQALGFLELVKFGFTRKHPLIIKIPSAAVISEMVEKAAYYRSDHRGSEPRDDIYDWLEAEKEIMARFGDLRPV
jgi:sterol desaturase/sphingolipid hydroxylase (fatty acid hydroxylase superfamily)